MAAFWECWSIRMRGHSISEYIGILSRDLIGTFGLWAGKGKTTRINGHLALRSFKYEISNGWELG